MEFPVMLKDLYHSHITVAYEYAVVLVGRDPFGPEEPALVHAPSPDNLNVLAFIGIYLDPCIDDISYIDVIIAALRY